MHKHLLAALAMLMYMASAIADLGAIQVKSYLNQKLNATIPLTNLKPGQDYTNLAIGLASLNRYQANGISYHPELGYLQFKVVVQAHNSYLQLSSTRALTAPVLNLLLHYQLGSDDFYRQYTLLLDPMDYVAVPTPVSTVPVSTAAVIKVNSGAQGEVDHTEPSPAMRPIPFSLANSNSRVIKARLIKASASDIYAADYTNPQLKALGANFNPQQFTLTTISGDSSYSLARFEQLLYPQANFSINQILLSLALVNYRKLLAPQQVYPAGVSVQLATPQQIADLNLTVADSYWWNKQLSESERLQILQNTAAQLKLGIMIESSDVFAPVVKQTVQMASQPVMVKPQPAPPGLSWDGRILAWRMPLLVGLVALILVWFGLRNYRWRRSLRNGTQHFTDQPLQFSPAGLRIEKPADQQREVTPNSMPDAIAASFNDQSPSDTQLQINPLNESVIPAVDEELINTLEQILTFDSGRNDVRVKLFELYINAGLLAKAKQIYAELDQVLDVDDNLRQQLQLLAGNHSFVANPNSNNTEVVNSEVSLNSSEGEAVELIKLTAPGAMPQEETSTRILEFSPVPTIPSVDKATPPPARFEPTRVVEFNGVNPDSREPTSSAEVERLDEQFNLARMYYDIEEFSRAKQILNNIATDAHATAEIRQAAQELSKEFGLNG